MPMDRVRTVWTGVAGTPWYTNMYFSNASGLDQAAAVTTKVLTFWNALRPQIVSGLTAQVEAEIPVIDERDGKMTGVHVGAGGTLTGTSADQLLPTATQALCQLFTNGFVNGRKVRGRIFIPGMVENNNLAGAPTPTIDTALQTALTALHTGAPVLVVWARPLKHSPPEADDRDGTHHTVVQSNVWSQWASLRSRRD